MKWLDEWCSAPPAAPCWDGVKMATGLIRAQHTDANESSALVRPSPLQFSIGRNCRGGLAEPFGVKIQLVQLEFLLVYTERSSSALAEGTYELLPTFYKGTFRLYVFAVFLGQLRFLRYTFMSVLFSPLSDISSHEIRPLCYYPKPKISMRL